MIVFGLTRLVSSSMVRASRSRRAEISASSVGMETGAVTAGVVTATPSAGWVALMRSSLESEVAAELGDVTGRLDVVEGVRDGAVIIDDDGAADDALDGLAVELLLAEGAPPVHHRPVRIRQEGDRQTLLLSELGELGRGIGRDAQHRVAVGLERLQGV